MGTRCNVFVHYSGGTARLSRKPDGFPEHVRNHVQNWLDMGSPGLLVDYLTEGPYKRHGFGDWPSYYIHVVVADPPHTVAMYSSCGGSWTLTGPTAEAEWQECVTQTESKIVDAFATISCDAYDWHAKGSAIADAIQALEELSRQRDDLDIDGEYPLPRFGLTQGGKKC